MIRHWRSLLAPVRPESVLDAPLLRTDEIRALARRAKQANRTDVHAREAVSRLHGDSLSWARGAGLDYDESRVFQPGDAPRFMNWRLTARTGEHFVKVFREERRPQLWVVVDRRATMRFGTRVRLKAGQAARLATLIAFSAADRQMTIGGVILEDRATWLRELTGDNGARHMAQAVSGPCPPRAQSAGAEVTLGPQLAALRASLPRGSWLYLISDFSDLDASLEPILFALSREHRVHALQVIDVAERGLPDAGTLWLGPGHGQPSRRVDTANARVREAYASAAADELAARAGKLRGLGIDCTPIAGDLDAIEHEIPLP